MGYQCMSKIETSVDTNEEECDAARPISQASSEIEIEIADQRPPFEYWLSTLEIGHDSIHRRFDALSSIVALTMEAIAVVLRPNDIRDGYEICYDSKVTLPTLLLVTTRESRGYFLRLNVDGCQVSASTEVYHIRESDIVLIETLTRLYRSDQPIPIEIGDVLVTKNRYSYLDA